MSDTEDSATSGGSSRRSARSGNRPAGSVLVRARWGHAYQPAEESAALVDQTPQVVTEEYANLLVEESGGIVEIVNENEEG